MPAKITTTRETSRLGPSSDVGLFDWRTFDPAILQGRGLARFATELVTYRDRLDELLRREGEYFAIKGTEILGYYRDRKSAVLASIRSQGASPVLIKRIIEREPVITLGQATP